MATRIKRIISYLHAVQDPDCRSWAGQLDFLADAEDSVATRMVFMTMTAVRLFETTLVSKPHYALVADYLDFLRNYELDEAEHTDSRSDSMSDTGSDSMSTSSTHSRPSSDMEGVECGLPVWPTSAVASFAHLLGPPPLPVAPGSAPPARLYDLPFEIGVNVADELSFEARVKLGQTSRSIANVVAQSLQNAAVRILAPFGLRFSDVRLLLTATKSFIGGSAVPALFHLGHTFQPADLDFCTGLGRGTEVVDFLKIAGGYHKTRESPEYSFAAGIGRIWTLINDDGMKINVLESISDNPFESVGNFHLTCVFGAWCANGLLHCYPTLTASAVAITTRAKLPVRFGAENNRSMWEVLHKYTDRGFTINLNEYDAPHTCGVDWSCPATLRRTDDGGCSYMPFPAWLYDDEAAKPPVCSWTMGGTGCPRGILANANGPCTVATSGQDLRWKEVVMEHLTSPVPPVPHSP
ncbi:hypothetical protein DFH06DRAFT_1331536 [Mycena polygramma]|nr:hypothetical protein DFH06DRAFT_1331536 [Mycena polygramma]